MKKKIFKLPKATLERLALYYKTLQNLDDEEVVMISTPELAEILDIQPEKIRKDLSMIGKFGMKGVGYDVINLKLQIGNILGLQNYWRLAIIGAGNFGTALANYEKVTDWGFIVAALFDVDEKKIGEEINGVRIYDFKKFAPISRRKLIDIGVIAVPDAEAQKVADILVEAGVKGIWNFTAAKLDAPKNVTVVDENLMIGLSALSFYLNQNTN